MTDENKGGQQDLPLSKKDLDAVTKRAEEAEKRAAEIEAREKKRLADEDKRKRADEVKTVDEAKRLADEAVKRAEEAEARAAAAEERIRKRIDSRFEKLPAETRERIAAFKDELSIDGWERMVDLELERDKVASAGGDDNLPYDSDGNTPSPPAAPAGAGRRNHKRDGRELHPKSLEILDELGQDVDAAKKFLEVEVENEGGRKKGIFVYPQKVLRKHLKDRATQPVTMTEENRRKLFGL